MKIIRSIIFPLILLAALPALPAHAWLKTQATTFATLPLGAGNPEALTVDGQRGGSFGRKGTASFEKEGGVLELETLPPTHRAIPSPSESASGMAAHMV